MIKKIIAKISSFLTKDKIAKEEKRVKSQNKRARVKGLEATLTVSQWITTLDGFNWQCAYCIEGPYTDLEHIMPISRGGGTTVMNCVPACKKCNLWKNDMLPEEIKESSRSPEAYKRIFAIMIELHSGQSGTVEPPISTESLQNGQDVA